HGGRRVLRLAPGRLGRAPVRHAAARRRLPGHHRARHALGLTHRLRMPAQQGNTASADNRQMPIPPTSIWSPLRQTAFRGLWICGAVFFVGNGMQTMAAAWLMVELTGSSFLAALVQTAVFLPMFLLALPAGVLADTTDRRRLMSGALLAQLAASLLLALLVFSGKGGPASVLLIVFICGCCTAMLTPAWNSSVVDPVPRGEWPQAITAIGIAYNAARAIGPTLAGLLFARLGAG